MGASIKLRRRKFDKSKKVRNKNQRRPNNLKISQIDYERAEIKSGGHNKAKENKNQPIESSK